MRPSIQVKLTKDGIPELLRRLQPELQAVLNKAAHDVEARAKASILNGEKSGIIYGIHQASAPGEAPANDLGNLAAGLGVDDGSGPLSKLVRSQAAYSADLELGTVKMAPRPFLGPALESVRQPFVRAVRRVIERG